MVGGDVRHKRGERDRQQEYKKRDSREGEWSEEAELISAVTHRQTGSQRQRGIYCRAQGEGKRTGRRGSRGIERGGLSIGADSSAD